MRNLSQEFIEKQNNGYRNYLKFADITLADGTILHLDNSDFWQNGFSFDDSVSGDNSFDIGAATINKFNLVINNIYDEFTKYVFTGAKAVCYIGLEISTGIEKIRICTGTVAEEPKQKSSVITLSFYDNMEKFDKDYSEVKTIFPATRNQIVRDICSYCGVTLQTVNFDQDDYIIQERPTDDALTCRQMLSWIAQIGCQWAKCDAYGRLCLGWYKNIIPGDINMDSNGTMSIYEGDKIVRLLSSENGVVTPETGYLKLETGNLSFISQNDYENRVNKTQNLTVNLDDVVITGVRVTEFIENSTEEKANTYLYGEEGYVLLVSNNKLIRKGTGQTIASMIGEKCVGMRFRPFSTSCLTDISIEAGDSVLITDKNGVSYPSYITSVTLNPGNFESISCSAEPAQRNSAKRYTSLEQTRVELNKNIQKEKTEREQALGELADRLENSPGVFTTVQTDTGGGKIFYLHNKPKLSESDIVWKMTAEAWAVSTDGGKTWNGGMTVDGDTIVRILTATGVNADWINAGAITVKDSNQNIIFSVDMDTKRVIISGDSVQIGGRPVQDVINSGITESKNYSDEKLSDYANIVSKDLENLQSQVDGQIEDYYYDYEPSMQNIPASQWTTTEERQKHIGDRFFWKSKGYAYRFMEDNGVWGWTLLQDTDITKAMQTAQNAKDVADGKRRTFITQPVPPYDIGDMWTNGEDILTCAVARATGSVYVSSDWQKLNTYTDDTVANEALEEARKSRNLNIILDNEYQGIPADYEGNIATFPTVKTVVQVLYGHTDVSADCIYTVEKSDGVTGTWNRATRTYTVTSLTSDTGWVDITASYLSLFTTTKRFNIAKIKGGLPGEQGTQGINLALKTVDPFSITGTNSTNQTAVVYKINDYKLILSKTITISFDYLFSDGATATRITIGQYDTPWQRPIFLYTSNVSGRIVYTWKEFNSNYASDAIGIRCDGFVGTLTISNFKLELGTVESPVWTPAIEDLQGSDGRGIKSTATTYQASTSGVDVPSGTWVSSPPTVAANQYLWTRTIITYTDNTTSTSYSIGKMGANGSPGRTYFMELSTAVVKQSQDNTIAPNYITMSAFYRDGTNTARTEYAGRFKIEETTDGDTWRTVYTSSNNESSVRHSLYSVLSTQSGGEITTATGQRIGIPRDVVALRCTLYAAGGTTQMLDMQSVAVVVDVDALTHEEVFNILTNNGEVKGIYKEGNQLYISFTYAKGGVLHLGGTNNGNGLLEVYDKNGNIIGKWSKDGIEIKGSNNNSQGIIIHSFEIKNGIMKATSPEFHTKISMARNSMGENFYDIFRYGPGYSFTIGGNPDLQYSDFETIKIVANQIYLTGNPINGGISPNVFISPHLNALNGITTSKINSVSGRFTGTVEIYQLNTTGSKKRIVKTRDYAIRSLYCYETPSPMFGDIGEAQTDESGVCYIYLDDIFQETINTDIEYQVFLQKEGQGDLWVDSKESAYFIVKGTPRLKFAWEIKAKQKDFEYYRLEDSETTEYDIENIDYETQGQKLFENYLLEKENQHEESN